MAEYRKLKVIHPQFGQSAALQRVTALADTAEARVEQKILFPYHHYAATCSVPTIAGRRDLRIDCLVEGINGTGATADPFAIESIDAPATSILEGCVRAEDALRIARRTVTHRLGRKFRLIAPFDVALEAAGVVHRGFWVIRVGDGRVMLDSVTGAVQSLASAA